MHAKLLQSCLTLWDLMDCSLPGSAVHEDSPGKNTGVGCHLLLHEIFLTQGSNLDHPPCRQTLPSEPYQEEVDSNQLLEVTYLRILKSYLRSPLS